MRLMRGAEAGERHPLAVPHRRNRRHAGADRLAVEMHRAGAALREAAAEMGVVKADVVTQRVKQRHVRIGIDRMVFAVDVEGEFLGHMNSFPWWGRPMAACNPCTNVPDHFADTSEAAQ